MAVRRYEDLTCWQLADELKRGVYELIDKSPAVGDRKFCDQLKDSAASAAANLAEAFGYYAHKQSARYATYAKSSLTETHNHLCDGVERKYWSSERVAPLLVVARRAIGATVGWLRYLSSTDAPPAYWEQEDDEDDDEAGGQA